MSILHLKAFHNFVLHASVPLVCSSQKYCLTGYVSDISLLCTAYLRNNQKCLNSVHTEDLIFMLWGPSHQLSLLCDVKNSGVCGGCPSDLAEFELKFNAMCYVTMSFFTLSPLQF